MNQASQNSPVLEARDAGMTFNPGTPYAVEAFRGVSFSVAPRETVAIVGPSGCGKSTLFNCIAGLLRPTSGAIFVGGKRVDDASGHVGYMLQKDLLLPWRTVLENVVIGLEVRGVSRRVSEERARTLIRSYGLAGFENAKPSQLSGGMRQRVAFMRTLAVDPEVILLDEPFSALDFQTRLLLQIETMSIIREQSKSAILVTHDIGEAITMADRIIVMTHRPARVLAIHNVELGQADRDPVNIRENPIYNACFKKIWSELDAKVAV
ncbi:MAG: ABC transporter ATP-binding protein [Bradyrhizobiaceae bacterium]|nr:MAG: ABC transporter ATP-binding protein [Bradyrhizobiaceae bacterium]